MASGWITLHRKVKDHWVYKDPVKFHAWITILLEVNHSENKVTVGNQIVVVSRGESVKSLITWAKLFGKSWSVGRVRGFFSMLESESMIERKPIRRSTHLKVCNYDTLQRGELSNKSQTNLKQISNKSQIATNNKVNKENNANNGVLGAHTALRLTMKPTQHDILRVTHFVHEYGLETVLTAISVFGDCGYKSIGSLLKVIKGELPPKYENQEPVDKLKQTTIEDLKR